MIEQTEDLLERERLGKIRAALVQLRYEAHLTRAHAEGAIGSIVRLQGGVTHDSCPGAQCLELHPPQGDCRENGCPHRLEMINRQVNRLRHLRAKASRQGVRRF